MGTIKKIKYPGRKHGSFEQEWLCHKDASEWWYCTGIGMDEQKNEYSFQFTLIKAHFGFLNIWMAHQAVTDVSGNKHYYDKKRAYTSRDVTITEDMAKFGDFLKIIKGKSGMHMTVNADNFCFDMDMEYGKGAFWHCDNGFLMMGSDDFSEKESTTYYSYPSMPTKGTITMEGRTVHVQGSSWFDKQGGPYSLVDRKTHWEWFSFRFFDNEQIMLFSFPQNNMYTDGTYITDKAPRLTNYTIKPLDFVEVWELRFSKGWEITMPGIKEEFYTVTPVVDGQMHSMYFEELCEVRNREGILVGKAFVELLPGVLNKEFANTIVK